MQAMAPCARQLCVLRPEFDGLSLDDQAAMLLACRIADAEAYRQCEIKQRALADWIRAGE